MDKIIYVPIGSDCKVTWYLHKNGYRVQAFPFDWTVTPIKSAVELLNNNFKDFFDKKNLVFLNPTKRLLFKNDDSNPELTNDLITPVYDKKYHILYVHDFSKLGSLEFDKVKEKYIRRTARLKSLLDNKHKICFIYKNDNPNDWQNSQYKQVNYKFTKLSQHEIEMLSANHQHTSLVSFDDFKKGTIL